jgi:hypothetical protein
MIHVAYNFAFLYCRFEELIIRSRQELPVFLSLVERVAAKRWSSCFRPSSRTEAVEAASGLARIRG